MRRTFFTWRMIKAWTCWWCGEFRMNFMYGWTTYKEEFSSFDDWPRCQECRGS